MSRSATCYGCGKIITVPTDYSRRKVQCPDCGVYCELPAQGTISQPRQVEPQVKRKREEKSEPAAPTIATVEREVEPKVIVKGRTKSFCICENCGEKVRLLRAMQAGKRRCPICGHTTDKAVVRAQKEELPLAISLPLNAEPVMASVKPSKDAYGVEASDDKRCPDCDQVLPPTTMVCFACGLNLQTGEKPERVIQPISKTWEAGLPEQTRWILFGIAQATFIVCGLAAVFVNGGLSVFIWTWVTATVLMAFLLGTWDRLDLSRNRKGQVNLVKSWKVCFFPLKPTLIKIRDYEGISYRLSHEPGFGAYFILLMLLPTLLLAFLWWYFVIHKESFEVTLTRDHGYGACLLYKGIREVHARDIAQTLADVSGLPCEGT